MKASEDPRADELRNKNMPSQDEIPSGEEEAIEKPSAVKSEDVRKMLGFS